MRAVEAFYRVQDVEVLLRVCRNTVIRAIRSGQFAGVVNIGGPVQPDYRIPASSINAWLESRRVFSVLPEPVVARTPGELRRKSENG